MSEKLQTDRYESQALHQQTNENIARAKDNVSQAQKVADDTRKFFRDLLSGNSPK